jgi:N-methylhydantoinase A/oxoprolinase/acetone carboxylase beta subunit
VRAIGVDVGGTFTDLVLWDDARGALAVFKLPSVPQDLAVDHFIRGLTATGTS